MIQYGSIETPIGTLHVFARDGALVFIDLRDDEAAARAQVRRRFPDEAIESSGNPGGATPKLRSYFSGQLAALDELKVDPGGTRFQAAVWSALRTVPTGPTVSYGELARRIGAGRSVRAVGAANGANPIPIVIPCHRVIGASGKLTGYGGGLERKAWLLRHEGCQLSLPTG